MTYYQEHRKERLLYQKKYRELHNDSFKEYQRNYYLNVRKAKNEANRVPYIKGIKKIKVEAKLTPLVWEQKKTIIEMPKSVVSFQFNKTIKFM